MIETAVTPAAPSFPTPHAAAHERAHRALGGAIRTVSAMTLLSRLGGLVRDVMLVHTFGNTAIGSAFAAAFAIPNMFRRLFGEGALSAAFIPEYTGAEKADPAEAGRFASLTLILLGLGTGTLTVVVEVVLMLTLMLAQHEPTRDLSLRLIMVMLPFMPLVCIAAILGGMLQVHGRFGPAASGPIILNTFIVAVGAWHMLHGQTGGPATTYALGVATVLSGLTQLLWFVWLLRRHVRWTGGLGDAAPRTRRMLARFIPVLMGLGTLQVNAFVDTLVAMWPIWVGPTVFGLLYPLNEASNGIVSFTQRLYQFPLGVFGIAVATAVFPTLARHADDPHAFAATLRRGLRLSFFIGAPASLGLMGVRHDITAVLFSGSPTGFNADGVRRSAAVLLGYAPGIWAYSLNHVFTRAFYATGDTRTPMRVAMSVVALNFLLNITLIWPLGEAGLAWSTSIAATIQCLLLARLSRRLLGMPDAREHVIDAPTARAMGRIVAAAALMLGVVGLVLWLIPVQTRWSGHLIRLAAGSLAGMGAFGVPAVLLGLPELRWLVARQTESVRGVDAP